MGWGGACSGDGSCAVTMNSNQAVSATFTLNRDHQLHRQRPPTGSEGHPAIGAIPRTGAPAVPNSGSVNVCINDGNSMPSAVTLDITASVDGLYIDTEAA